MKLVPDSIKAKSVRIDVVHQADDTWKVECSYIPSALHDKFDPKDTPKKPIATFTCDYREEAIAVQKQIREELMMLEYTDYSDFAAPVIMCR